MLSYVTEEPRFTKVDYGSNISLFEGDDKFFETNADKFLPDDSEFDEDWDVSEYIRDYLSFYDLTPEQREYAEEALWSSKLRYIADDSYAQWRENQKQGQGS